MNILLITYPLSALLIFALAIGLGIFLTRRFRLGWRLFWIGAATFILSQVGHIPFNSLLTLLFQRGLLPLPPEDWRLPFNAVVLGLSAGLWEELARYAMYRWWAKDARSWGKGLLLGAGHGGIEALIIGFLVLLTFVNMFAMRGADLSALVPPEQLTTLQAQVDQYWSAPLLTSLLSFIERTFTIIAHLTFSVIVLQAFTRGGPRWVALAVGLHALLDAVSVYAMGTLAQFPWGLYAVEGIVGLFSLAFLGILFALRQPEPVEADAEEQPLPPPPGAVPLPVEVDPENLEKTRYI